MSPTFSVYKQTLHSTGWRARSISLLIGGNVKVERVSTPAHLLRKIPRLSQAAVVREAMQADWWSTRWKYSIAKVDNNKNNDNVNDQHFEKYSIGKSVNPNAAGG